MTTRVVVTDDKLGQVATKQWELFRRVKEGTLDPEWVAAELQRIIEEKIRDLAGLLAAWQSFYKDAFRVKKDKKDLSNLAVPGRKPGFDRLVVVIPGMTPERLFQKCRELFPAWKWTDRNLDGVVISERTAKDDAYAVWFRDRVEADEEFKNLSANNLKERGTPGITLEERLLMELEYFMRTGKHLDIQNVTLCAGSRDSDGDVPGVRWGVGGLEVRWHGPDGHDGGLRAREAVS